MRWHKQLPFSLTMQLKASFLCLSCGRCSTLQPRLVWPLHFQPELHVYTHWTCSYTLTTFASEHFQLRNEHNIPLYREKHGCSASQRQQRTQANWKLANSLSSCYFHSHKQCRKAYIVDARDFKLAGSELEAFLKLLSANYPYAPGVGMLILPLLSKHGFMRQSTPEGIIWRGVSQTRLRCIRLVRCWFVHAELYFSLLLLSRKTKFPRKKSSIACSDRVYEVRRHSF